MSRTLNTSLDIRLMNFTASVLFAIFVVLLMGFALARFARLPLFAIGAIEVSGDVAHNNAINLRANALHHIQGTFFTVDLTQARAAFEAVPWVRQAVVKRYFPNRLRVNLQEHRVMAMWGAEGDTLMVNSFGEVFEGNSGDVETDELPRLIGPAGQSQKIWSTFQALQPAYASLDMMLDQLEMTGSGGWRAHFDSGAQLELGRGSTAELVERSERFLKTVEQVTARYARNPDSLESADLRYTEGYAIRLRGVTTGADSTQPKAQ